MVDLNTYDLEALTKTITLVSMVAWSAQVYHFLFFFFFFWGGGVVQTPNIFVPLQGIAVIQKNINMLNVVMIFAFRNLRFLKCSCHMKGSLWRGRYSFGPQASCPRCLDQSTLLSQLPRGPRPSTIYPFWLAKNQVFEDERLCFPFCFHRFCLMFFHRRPT